jgi:serine/threonine protein kinase
MLTGELPFPHNNTSEMIKAIVLENPTLLPESFPKEIGIIINQALAKEPFERYKSAEQMRSDLQKFLFKFKSSSTKNFINPFIENIGSTRDSAKTKTAFNKDFKNKQSTKKHQFIDSNNKKNKISLGKYQITGVFALLLLLATYLLYSGTLKNYFQKNQNELDNSSTIKSKSESLESKNINLNTTNKINSNRIDSDKSQSQEVKTEPANQSNLSLKPILKVRKEKSLK